MRQLEKVEYKGKLYFLDERLKQLRSVVLYPDIIEFLEFKDIDMDEIKYIEYVEVVLNET